MRRSNLSLVLSLLVVFASGVVVGALGHRYYSLAGVSAKTAAPKTPEEYKRAYMSEMNTRLKLSPDQLHRLDLILDETRAKYRELREKSKPQMKVIQEEQVAAISAMLSAEQKTEYDKIRAEREARRKAEAEAKEHAEKAAPQGK